MKRIALFVILKAGEYTALIGAILAAMMFKDPHFSDRESMVMLAFTVAFTAQWYIMTVYVHWKSFRSPTSTPAPTTTPE